MKTYLLNLINATTPVTPPRPMVVEGVDSKKRHNSLFILWCSKHGFSTSVPMMTGKRFNYVAGVAFSLVCFFASMGCLAYAEKSFVPVFASVAITSTAAAVLLTYFMSKDENIIALSLIERDMKRLSVAVVAIKPHWVVRNDQFQFNSGYKDCKRFSSWEAGAFLGAVAIRFKALLAEAMIASTDVYLCEGKSSDEIWAFVSDTYCELNAALLSFDLSLRSIERYVEETESGVKNAHDQLGVEIG